MRYKITGHEFKAIRELCGFSAREVAVAFKAQGTPVSTSRSVYRLEEGGEVPWRYVAMLRELLGDKLFDHSLVEIRGVDGAAAKEGGRTRRKGRECEPEIALPPDATFYAFLNALPMTGNTVAWITQFRETLRMLFDDVDRVVINVNLDCDLDNPEDYRTDVISTEHIDSKESPQGTVLITGTRDDLPPAERLLENFRRQGYPLERYHPPFAVDCYLAKNAYLGTVFLWRDRSVPDDISEKTRNALLSMRHFLTFALSYVVARARHVKPLDHAFNDALSYMTRTADLSDQETRVVILQLFGHSYEEIADRLYISIDTVRKHIKNIYRKTETHSNSELFAKYFTPRLGF